MDSFYELDMSSQHSTTLWGPDAFKTAIPVQSTASPTTPPYSQSLQLERQMLSLHGLTSSDGRPTSVIASPGRQPACSPPTPLMAVGHGHAVKRRGKGFVDPCDIAPLRKRRIQLEMLSPDERHKVVNKREKNKVAAEKCRVKRRQKVQQTRAEYDEYLEANEALEAEIQQLRELKEQLEEVLENHHCTIKLKA